MITGTDDQGAYQDSGEAIVATQRPSISVSYQSQIVTLPTADTGTGSTKTTVPPARPSTARR